MQIWPILQALVLVLVANGTPVVATRLLGTWGDWPIDAGRSLADGRRVFGQSKTWRGLGLAVTATSATSFYLGLPWTTGAIVGLAAMAGDLGSSFIKRRMGMTSGSMSPGLDQVPEALLPLLACRGALGLSLGEALLSTALFWLTEVVLSPLLFRLGIRERPY